MFLNQLYTKSYFHVSFQVESSGTFLWASRTYSGMTRGIIIVSPSTRGAWRRKISPSPFHILPRGQVCRYYQLSVQIYEAYYLSSSFVLIVLSYFHGETDTYMFPINQQAIVKSNIYLVTL